MKLLIGVLPESKARSEMQGKSKAPKVNTMKKFCLFAFLVVAALGRAWGIGMTSVKVDFSDESELSRFTGLWGWNVGVVSGGEVAVLEDWESGVFFENREPMVKDVKIKYKDEAFTCDPVSYYSNNHNDFNVFALVKLPEGGGSFGCSRRVDQAICGCGAVDWRKAGHQF